MLAGSALTLCHTELSEERLAVDGANGEDPVDFGVGALAAALGVVARLVGSFAFAGGGVMAKSRPKKTKVSRVSQTNRWSQTGCLKLHLCLGGLRDINVDSERTVCKPSPSLADFLELHSFSP